jgi:hypothetical protein
VHTKSIGIIVFYKIVSYCDTVSDSELTNFLAQERHAKHDTMHKGKKLTICDFLHIATEFKWNVDKVHFTFYITFHSLEIFYDTYDVKLLLKAALSA